MSVLEFPGEGDAFLAALVEAQLETRADDERFVWIRSLNTQNDLASLLIPFRMAAKAAGLGLPERLPGLEVAACYRPSQAGLEIGGDWYDAYNLPDGAVAVAIGDVQGHDVEAAAFMGQVCGFMRAIADLETAPEAVLERTNELLVKRGTSRFASCTMLHVDAREGRVSGTSGGHVPMLRAHKDGSHEVYTLPGGPVLGIIAGADYPGKTWDLDDDSVLVMVTDGVVEGPGLTLDAGLEQAGKLAAGAVREGLSAHAIAERVLRTADLVDHPDDAAVLVIRRA